MQKTLDDDFDLKMENVLKKGSLHWVPLVIILMMMSTRKMLMMRIMLISLGRL